MIANGDIWDDVTDELRWDPQLINPGGIGVAVVDGAVTLTGHVLSYAEKMAAARAAERVDGVRAVANDLHVDLAGSPRDDSDIAAAIAHVMEWNVQVPESTVQARVEDGWVTLDGTVQHDYQRREVERIVSQVRGVLGVANGVTLKPAAIPKQVGRVIEDAFRREAQVAARHLEVKVSGHIAMLYGNVHSVHESAAATAAVTEVPGITTVENHLVVVP
jgi:osmotically-inducible protein OsmY